MTLQNPAERGAEELDEDEETKDGEGIEEDEEKAHVNRRRCEE